VGTHLSIRNQFPLLVVGGAFLIGGLVKNWIALWELTDDVPPLNAPRGTVLACHRHPQAERMVMDLVWVVDEKPYRTQRLNIHQIGLLLDRHHLLRFLWSQPPSPALYLREAARFSGAGPLPSALTLLA